MEATLFWQAASAAAAIATVVGGLAAGIISTWVQRRNRPEADWSYVLRAGLELTSRGNPDPDSKIIRVSGTISNAGDASAYRITMKGPAKDMYFAAGPIGPSGGRNFVEVLPALRSGESAEFFGEIPVEQWDTAEITIDWITSPTRLKKHLQLDLRPSDEVPIHPTLPKS